ncbi:signal transduction histidine kinase (STHK), LytS [Crocosphaera sp. UHCC 0190]|uniref:signal transduction histidine kinase (STHK), LytS n=1 Tax=Crocosphaera sp. UHCC 0190 TaxID=3110246 RepID=UPI002B21B357|nr:signal transduction histidine kinase (STHK), LytS [Crocosphaera sp. UHCC 0190]MEA5509407.1 signal transduction histidine kinase (STHK), LytS [Crocosphaera sp. UHCC 0190]
MNRYTEVTGASTSNRLRDVGNLDSNEKEVPQTAAKGTVAGGAVGGLTGLLIGLGLVAIPGIGPIMLAGAAATAIATTISGTVIGAAAGTLAGGLVGLGIPADRAKIYSDRVSDGDYLVMVEGSEADIDLAKSIFDKHSIDDWYAYDLPSESVQTTTTVSNRHSRV